MLLCAIILGWASALQVVEAQFCEDFLSNQVCPPSVDNLVYEIPNIESPGLCQAECFALEDCSFFTWVRFAASVPYPPACFLYRFCESTEECGDNCEYSITGPRSPAYPAVCCNEFQTGLACDNSPDNILDVENGVADAQACQQLCQELMPCGYFNYDSALDSCFLLQSCNEKIPCGDCTSGPKYPDMDICPGSGKQAAVLLGGFPERPLEVESWPCGLSIPDTPEIRSDRPGTALIGSKLFLCGGFLNSSDAAAECFFLESDAWIAGPTMTTKRRFFPLIAVGDRLVAPGGSDRSAYHSSVEVLHINDMSWKLTWTLPYPRNGHCGVRLSDTEIILAGGWDGKTYFNAVEKYNVETGVRENLANLATGMTGLACAISEDNFFVSGGMDQHNNPFASAETLSLSTNTWSSLPSMNTRRWFHTMGIINGDLVVFGGEDTRNMTLLSTIEILNGSTWLTEELKQKRSRHAMVQIPCP